MELHFDIRAYSDEEYEIISQLVRRYETQTSPVTTNPVIKMKLDAVESILAHCRLRIPFEELWQCSTVLDALDRFGKFLPKDQRDKLPHLRTKVNALWNDLAQKK